MADLKLAVVPQTEAETAKARELSELLGYALMTPPLPDTVSHALLVSNDGLSLQCLLPTPMRPIQADFCSKTQAKRFHPQAWRQELIARACGFKQNNTPQILDATGGFGDDAFALASLGAHVTVLERSPLMHTLLSDALTQAQQKGLAGASRMQLIQADAQAYLNANKASYDVIYLDPMYPDPDKRSLVKKRCRAIRDIVGDDSDADTLLALALTHAPRVVVKRPRLAPPLAGETTKNTLLGKSIRFDLYLNPKEH